MDTIKINEKDIKEALATSDAFNTLIEKMMEASVRNIRIEDLADEYVKIDEMEKLENYLKVKDIPYEIHKVDCKFWNGKCYKQICVPVFDPDKRSWDAVCNPGTYGFEDGLLEIMGSILTPEDEEYDSVVGFLTSKEVIKRIELKEGPKMTEYEK